MQQQYRMDLASLTGKALCYSLSTCIINFCLSVQLAFQSHVRDQLRKTPKCSRRNSPNLLALGAHDLRNFWWPGGTLRPVLLFYGTSLEFLLELVVLLGFQGLGFLCNFKGCHSNTVCRQEIFRSMGKPWGGLLFLGSFQEGFDKFMWHRSKSGVVRESCRRGTAQSRWKLQGSSAGKQVHRKRPRVWRGAPFQAEGS